MKLLFNSKAYLIGAIVLLSVIAGPVMADDVSHFEARKLREAGQILPLETIIEKAMAFRKGDVIDTELERDNGMLIYEIEILDAQGRVWELELDATKIGRASCRERV